MTGQKRRGLEQCSTRPTYIVATIKSKKIRAVRIPGRAEDKETDHEKEHLWIVV